MDIAKFVAEVKRLHATGQATEHSYRAALGQLFDSIAADVSSINEPTQGKSGRPDFVLIRTQASGSQITVGHCEAKDVGIDISPKGLKDANKDQFERYRAALNNLIYTNGLEWRFYKNGEFDTEIRIGDYAVGITAVPENYDALENKLKDFVSERLQTITSAETLAEMMAGKAVLMKDVLFRALRDDADLQTELAAQYQAFKDQLIHDLTPEGFADIYAETVAYGLFAARLHDDTPADFTRQEALRLLPRSNPFLRKLFEFVAGPGLDEALRRTVDELVEIFQATNLQKLFKNFGRFTRRNDPFIHFYETFLAKYNPSKRKARGVWYTPEPVVNFIVRAVDDVLKEEFGLSQGLADTLKTTIDWDTGQTEIFRGKARRIIQKREVHRVQILDPAAGTGTFLAEVIRQIGERVKGVAPGQWSSYVEKEMIPRLHGFELLMASYAMCHMKLDMMLTQMGYQPTGNPPRIGVYLTNSLEEGERVNQTLPFAQWLSNEAKQANTVKNDVPVMVVIGNPPYSGISQNMGDWITSLIEDYKYVDGQHFGERKHWLHDDYVKFIRLSESLIDKNGGGIVGFITNHGYLDNPTFRGMRWHLLNTFDRIHVIDLHGNANKKEVTPEGKPDKNVFDIQQGVAIIIAVKTGKKTTRTGEVWHGDLWGSREGKYASLEVGRIGAPVTKRIEVTAPQYAFVPRDHTLSSAYSKGFKIADFMPANVTGIVTAKDGLVIDFTKQGLEAKITRFVDPAKTDAQVRAEFFPDKKAGQYPPGDSRGWKLPEARVALQSADWASDIETISYRPFDTRAILYRSDMVDWGRFDMMPNLLNGQNVALIFSRQAVRAEAPPVNVLVTQHIFDNRGVYSNKGISQAASLYLYPNEQDLDQTRQVNFDHKLWRKLQELAKHPTYGIPDELQTFDYVYGVLHCPSYRDTFAEFLKIDFPRIPWPSTPAKFWNISAKGTELRRLHLMDPEAIGSTPYPFNGEGNSIVDKPHFEEGKVWINKTQHFDATPEVSWRFFIGGYQPAQKWLKDRKGRSLGYEDILHYQKIIKILFETDRIMKEIELPL